MRPRELVKRIERGEKWRPTSRDIEQFRPKNTGIKRGFIRRWFRENRVEILACALIVIIVVGGLVVLAEVLPDPVMP